MNSFMTDLKLRLSATRQPSTVNRMMSNLSTVSRKMTRDRVFNNLGFLNSLSDIKTLYANEPVRTTKTIIATAISAMDCFPILYSSQLVEYRTYFKELANRIEAEDASNIKTEKQKRKMVSFQELEKARDSLKVKVEGFGDKPTARQYQDVQAYMLFVMATMMNDITRNMDFCTMVVVPDMPVNEDKDKNYFVSSLGFMIMNKYKTSHKYGRKLIQVGDEVNRILNECLDLRPFPYTNEFPFFVNLNGSAISKAGGLQRLYERSGLDISPTIIRNIVATHRLTSQPFSLERLKQNANAFSHTVEQHIKYVRF